MKALNVGVGDDSDRSLAGTDSIDDLADCTFAGFFGVDSSVIESDEYELFFFSYILYETGVDMIDIAREADRVSKEHSSIEILDYLVELDFEDGEETPIELSEWKRRRVAPFEQFGWKIADEVVADDCAFVRLVR